MLIEGVSRVLFSHGLATICLDVAAFSFRENGPAMRR
jgi:hypothetical protein